MAQDNANALHSIQDARIWMALHIFSDLIFERGSTPRPNIIFLWRTNANHIQAAVDVLCERILRKDSEFWFRSHYGEQTIFVAGVHKNKDAGMGAIYWT